MSTELTKLVLRYQQLLTTNYPVDAKTCSRLYREIEERCFLIIYLYPVQIHLLDEEEAADLLLSLKPRLKHIVETFSYDGMPFENFLRRISYMQANVHNKRSNRIRRKYVCIPFPEESFDYLNVSDNPMTYGSQKQLLEPDSSISWQENTEISRHVKQKIVKSKSFRRRFLQLVLLCSEELNANQIKFLASYMGVAELNLAKDISNAYEKSYDKRMRTQQIARIRDYHFVEKTFCQRELNKLKSCCANSSDIEKMQTRIEREEKLFLERRLQMQNRAEAITHDVVGELTAVPKGTVDSGVSAIKRYLTEMIDGTG